MPLPSAAQAQRERLAAEEAAPPSTVVAPTVVTPPANDDANTGVTQPSTDEATRVTLSKEEFNILQAARDRTTAAERRAEASAADLLALQSRLTELEEAAKGSGNGGTAPAAPAPTQASSLSVDSTQIPLTDKEKADFEEDTLALMEKIATNVVRRELGAYNQGVSSKLGEIEGTARTASTNVNRVASNNFTDNVRSKVAEFSDFQTIVTHPHWQDFLKAEDELSDKSIGEILQAHVTAPQRNSLDKVVKIFKLFFDRYIKDAPSSDGYAGAVPSGATVVDINAGSGTGPKTLKYSDRKKLHDDYIARRISYDAYKTKKDEFDVADREGRVDYNS